MDSPPVSVLDQENLGRKSADQGLLRWGLFELDWILVERQQSGRWLSVVTDKGIGGNFT